MFTDDAGVQTDRTADFQTGTPGAPAQVVLSDPGTLSLCEGTLYANIVIDAPGTVTIQGAGAGLTVISGEGGVAIDHVGDDATAPPQLHWLALRWLSVVDSGAPAVRSVNGHLDLGYVDVTDSAGTGVSAESGTVTVRGGVFARNGDVNSTLGAAIFTRGGGAVFDAIFDSNEAFEGGAAFTEGPLELHQVEAFDNYSEDGGAVAWVQPGASLTVEGGLFSGSGSTFAGTAIWCWEGTVSVSDAVIQNSAGFSSGTISGGDCGIELTRTQMLGNAVARGGAIDGYQSVVTVVDSVFDGNTATNGDGGAVRSMEGTLSVIGSTLSNNGADSTGGAIYAFDSDVFLEDTDLIGNIAVLDGGGIRAQIGTLSTTRVRYQQNQGRHGGGLRVEGPALVDLDSEYTDNVATGAGGDPLGGGLSGNGNGVNTITGAVFSGNLATATPGGRGGGVHWFGNATLELRDTQIVSNEAGDLGGGGFVAMSAGSVLLEDSSVTDNLADRGAGLALDGPFTFSCEGAVGVDAGMRRNLAAVEGGGLWLADDPSLTAVFTDCDLGVAPDDNGPDDVRWEPGASYLYSDDHNGICFNQACY